MPVGGLASQRTRPGTTSSPHNSSASASEIGKKPVDGVSSPSPPVWFEGSTNSYFVAPRRDARQIGIEVAGTFRHEPHEMACDRGHGPELQVAKGRPKV